MSKLPGQKSRYQPAFRPFQMHGSSCGEHVRDNDSEIGPPSGLLRFSIFSYLLAQVSVEVWRPKTPDPSRKHEASMCGSWCGGHARDKDCKFGPPAALVQIFIFEFFLCWSIGQYWSLPFLHFSPIVHTISILYNYTIAGNDACGQRSHYSAAQKIEYKPKVWGASSALTNNPMLKIGIKVQ